MRITVRVEGLDRRPFAPAAARVAARRLAERGGRADGGAGARSSRDGAGEDAGPSVGISNLSTTQTRKRGE